MEEAVALGVVGLARDDRRHEVRDAGRVHLPVGVQLHEHRRASLERGAIARDDGSAHALVLVVAQDDDARVLALALHEVAGALGARVVDHVDRLALRSDARQHAQHVPARPVARDDGRDPGRAPHAQGGRLARARARHHRAQRAA
jgi:hypothetical protein